MLLEPVVHGLCEQVTHITVIALDFCPVYNGLLLHNVSAPEPH